MLGDKPPTSKGSSFYIENLLGSPYRRETRSPEVCAGRLERNCKSLRQRFLSEWICYFPLVIENKIRVIQSSITESNSRTYGHAPLY